MNKQLVILDRDGVINEDSDEYIKSPDEFIPIDGSLMAITELNRAGLVVVVATNQSGIARGYFDEVTLNKMHEKLNRLLSQKGGKIDGIYFCPHGPDDECECRKPAPGMIRRILEDYKLNPSSVVAVGDSLRDLQAAHAMGVDSILVRTGKGQKTETQLSSNEHLKDTPVYDDLAVAVQALLN